MILISILKLPINLLAELLKFAGKLEAKNKTYFKDITIKFIRRWKQ